MVHRSAAVTFVGRVPRHRLARGDIDLLVSTQAALWLNGGWSKLALVVEDEQHK
jgi:RecG-like helicase